MTAIQNQVAHMVPTAASFAPKPQGDALGPNDFFAFMSQETAQVSELFLDAPHPELAELQEIDLNEMVLPPLPTPLPPRQVYDDIRMSVFDVLSIDKKPIQIASDWTPLEPTVEKPNLQHSADAISVLPAPAAIRDTLHALIDGASQTGNHPEASQALKHQDLDARIDPTRPQAVAVQPGLQNISPTTVTTSQVQPPPPLVENQVAHKIDAQQPTTLPTLPAVAQSQDNVAPNGMPLSLGIVPVNQSTPNLDETVRKVAIPQPAANAPRLPDGILIETRFSTLEAPSASWTQPSPATEINMGSHRSAVLFGANFFANSPQLQSPLPSDTTSNLQDVPKTTEMPHSPKPKTDWFAATAQVTPTPSSPPNKISTTLGDKAAPDSPVTIPSPLPPTSQPVTLPFAPQPQSLVSQTPVPLPSLAAQIKNYSAAGKQTSVELALAPEELGKIRLVLTPEGDKLRVVIHAERPETMELLRRNTEGFTAELRQAGFNNTSFSFGSWGDSPRGHSPQPNSTATQRFTELTPPPVSIPEPSKVSGHTGLDLRV